MEGGMAGNFLDPAAQEFHPAVAPAQFSLPPPPAIYCPYGAAPAQALPMPFYPSTQLNPSPYVSPAAALPDTKPTRSLLLSSVAPQTMESTVRVEMEAFGGVRAVEMGRLHGEGLITVHFYDLRSAQAAVAEIREQHVRQQSLMGQQYGFVGMVPASSSSNWAGGWAESCSGRIGGYCGGGGQVVVAGRGLVAGRAVWAQFAPEAPGLDGPNNGSLVVFNLDSNVSSAALKDVFQVFGAVKELRETPLKPRHRFVEFFDIRDAARALCELNGKEIFGKRMVIEFSRPGGQQARSYCRKGSAHPATPLPPRLLRLPRTHSFSGDQSSSPSGAGATSSSPPAAPIARECSLESTPDKATAADKIGARRGKGRSVGAGSSSTKLQSGRHKGWKSSFGGKGRTAAEARFLIKEATSSGGSAESPSSSSCIDTRTTVMIKNIPNKYSQKLLLNMLDNHCIHCNERIAADGDESEPASAYDFVYLPIDFNNKCNVGYGFVNLTSPEATWRFYKAFHMQPWEVFNSRKICQVTYARLQGLEALKEHFKNSKFACDTDEYMPVVFYPPRDGKALTDPVSVGSRGGAAVLTDSGKRKMAALMEEMGAPSSNDRLTDGAGCSSPSKTEMSDRLEGEEIRSCSGGGDDASGDDDYEGRELGGGGGVDMTDFTEALRHHQL